MKIFVGFLLCLFLVSCDNFSVPGENHQVHFSQFTQDAHISSDSTFKVVNLTHVNIGEITINLIDSTNAYLNVSDSGNYSVHINTDPKECHINGQLLQYDVAAWITISSHISIHASWVDNVIVVDRNEEN